MIKVGHEVFLYDEKGTKEVVVLQRNGNLFYVEHEDGHCEWRDRHELGETRCRPR